VRTRISEFSPSLHKSSVRRELPESTKRPGTGPDLFMLIEVRYC
jgi:hypothetical protein